MQICKDHIEFLGLQIHKDDYSPSTRNIGKIKSLVRPKTKKGVRSLLGLANYFRALIPKYTEIVNPLVNLTKDKINFKWDKDTEMAF